VLDDDVVMIVACTNLHARRGIQTSTRTIVFDPAWSRRAQAATVSPLMSTASNGRVWPDNVIMMGDAVVASFG
jgi:hypothetical protein